VLYFFIKEEKIILTHGFIKKTNKTPQKEIERAIKLRKAYMTSIMEDK
jgi:phage-related protein